MFTHIKLRTRISIALLVVGAIPILLIGIISVINSGKALSNLAFAQLSSIREMKKTQIQDYFNERKSDMNNLAETVSLLMQRAFEKIKTVQENKNAHIAEYFNRCLSDIRVISKNPLIIDSLNSFASIIDENGTIDQNMYRFYEEVKYQNILKQYIIEYGYYDLMLITKQGKIVYTVNRESDLGQNVLTGDLKTTGLAVCFEKGLKEVFIKDFEIFPPSNHQYILFIAAPIILHEDFAGVLVIKINSKPINAIIQRREGMGNTGESYIVGELDGKITYRSDRVVKAGKIGEAKSDPDVNKALAGETGIIIKESSTSRKVTMSGYQPLKIPGLHWGLITSINLEEVIVPQLEGEEENYFAKYIKQYDYNDLYLIDSDGDIFYSVLHQADYLTNIISGQYAESGLGRLVKKVIETRKFGFSDFEPYAPSNGKPFGFFALPIIRDNSVELVVALQISIKPINDIMLKREGMGKTGESYLIGRDGRMRSDSYLDPEHFSVQASFSKSEKGKIVTEGTQNALSGKIGHAIIKDYRGKQVLCAYTHLKLDNIMWGLVTEIDEDEALGSVKVLKRLISGLGLISFVLVITITLWFTRYLIKPITRVINGLIESAEKVSFTSAQVAVSSMSLSEGATEQAASIEETSASLEEMSSMTTQNADHAIQTNELMKEANQVIIAANDAMSRLTNAMSEISNASKETSAIVKTIDEVAFQTKLLALNAAIEAARAGEAGTGFAVVADEVRNLARQTSDAAKNTTDLIERTITKINEGSKIVTNTDQAFNQVTAIAGKIDELVGDIAAASKEQAAGIQQVNNAVSEMDKVIQQTAANAQESASASEEMKTQALELKGYVVELIALVEGAAE